MEKLVVLGAGESGVGAAILGQKKGFSVFVSDRGKIKKQFKEVLLNNNIDWEEETHNQKRILAADLVVKSPGIPRNVAILKEIDKKNIPVISEIEFASRYTNATIIAITGSNGKTTVTNWISYVFENAGLNFAMAGNVGISFAKSVATKKVDYYVLEVSSFQLDDIKDFHPHIAVLTNITPDHLDRYDYNFQNYIDAKFKITKNQNEDDFFIYDADDEVIEKQLKVENIKAEQVSFSLDKINGNGTEITTHQLTTKIDNNIFNMATDEITLRGKHNAKNAMAASTVASIIKIRKETIRKSLANFQGVEHRLENVLKIGDVLYINDSKATNINATFYALESVKNQIVWIVGGQDKGNDYSELLPLVHEKVKAIVCLGVDNSKIINSFNNCIDQIYDTQSMKDAVEVAHQIAEKGDTVLLSPACASFDLFENYEDRGRQFKKAVSSL